MGKLRLRTLEHDKPVRLTIEVSAATYCDLQAYAELHAAQTGAAATAPSRLISPMLEQFMGTDREFAKARRQQLSAKLR